MSVTRPAKSHDVIDVTPGQGDSGIVLVCEHASSFIPADLENLRMTQVDRLSHAAWDPGALEVARHMALAWGAPMFTLGTVPWIWVPDQITARRAERTLGAATWDDHAAVILVPPTPLACMDRQDAPSGSLNWPTLHPLYLALDLAQDRARGHEILEAWTPPIPSPRPWVAPT